MASDFDAVPEDTDSIIQAETLKSQGNELHMRGDHKAAYQKYTEAIELDDQNAVLFANRAATSMATNHDALETTRLDPSYAKAWGRLGKSLYEIGQYERSSCSWSRALECTTSTCPTEDDKRLKQQFEEGMRLAAKEYDRTKQMTMDEAQMIAVDVSGGERQPWNKAAAMEDELKRNGVIDSSEFKLGEQLMNMLTDVNEGVLGRPGAITHLSNAILQDDRVFHMNTPDWFSKLQKQTVCEQKYFDGWLIAGPGRVIEEAPLKLRELGWDKTRKSIGFTVRAWVIRGYLESKMKQDNVAVVFFDSDLEGRAKGRTWRDLRVHVHLKRLRVDAYVRICSQTICGCAGPDLKLLLNTYARNGS